jgi:hypothetical protein
VGRVKQTYELGVSALAAIAAVSLPALISKCGPAIRSWSYCRHLCRLVLSHANRHQNRAALPLLQSSRCYSERCSISSEPLRIASIRATKLNTSAPMLSHEKVSIPSPECGRQRYKQLETQQTMASQDRLSRNRLVATLLPSNELIPPVIRLFRRSGTCARWRFELAVRAQHRVCRDDD